MYHFVRQRLVWRWPRNALSRFEQQSICPVDPSSRHSEALLSHWRYAATSNEVHPIPMRVLVVHNRFRSANPSGEDRVVDQEHAALSCAGHTVERFERHSDDIAHFSPSEKARIPGQMLWSFKAAREFDAVVRNFRPDVVHVHSLFPLISPSVLRACQTNRVPTVVTIHAYDHVCCGGNLFRAGVECRECVGRRLPLPGLFHGCYRDSRLASLPMAVAIVAHRPIWRSAPDAYIFLSNAQHRELLDLGFPPSRCFVKPNFTTSPPARDPEGDLVLHLGRLDEGKGIRVLMRAWDRYLSMPGPRALRLAIAGSGPLENDVRAWAFTRPSVEMHGLVSRDRCAELLAQAAAAVVPSEWPEPFGLVVIEAMAAGVAPIATTQGALPELITDQVDGLLYPAGDDASLAMLLQRIQDSPEWFAELGAAAKQTYEQRFSQAVNLLQLEAIYRFAIDHPRWAEGPQPGPMPTFGDPSAATTTVLADSVADRHG
jgi:glycosyltransferase involved in cell wall biosynthesis